MEEWRVGGERAGVGKRVLVRDDGAGWLAEMRRTW